MGNDNSTPQAKYMACANKYLERRGYDIAIECHEAQGRQMVVAYSIERDAIVFAYVVGGAPLGQYPKLELTREEAELDMVDILPLLPDEYNDFTVCLDAIEINVLSNDRAIVRHHLNCLDTVYEPKQKVERLVEAVDA